MSASQIILNSSNYNESSNSFIHKFLVPQEFDNRTELGLSSINVFNSFYNISSKLGNNKVTLYMPSGSSDYISTVHTITDGFYDTSSFNLLLNKICYDNGFYTIPSTGKVTYYLNLSVSAAQYANTITTYAIPIGTEPAPSGSWLVNTGTQRTMKIAFSEGLGVLFGFKETTPYGASNSDVYSINSDTVPKINPASSLILTCSMIKNRGIAMPSNFLYSLGINASFGSLIVNPSHELIYNSVIKGQVTELEIKIYDENMNRVELLDNNILIVLSLKR